ncbi:MAG: HD domain-containing protein [Nitrospirae bacterium]|nr:HD domain-containing protein [Nitrospirota bacterium]MBF0535057.1 HD domain-containing protein [Nitrospirota bacterium]MBF0616565.1 HD domain-containing protein [Nitrospirota bacterium]
MSIVKLSRLLKNKNLSAVIEAVSKTIESPVCILDTNKTVLLGTIPEGPYMEHPVEASGETSGWVLGQAGASALAQVISYALEREIEKKSLTDETLERYRELSFLFALGEKVALCFDVREVAQLCIDETLNIFGAPEMFVMLADDKTLQMKVVAATGAVDSRQLPGIFAPWISENTLSAGRAEVVNDVAGHDIVHSFVYAPLKVKNKINGVIFIYSTKPRTFTSGDVKLLNTIASQVAVATESARLFEKLHETFFTTVHALAETIEKRDPYTGNHTKRVMEYSLAIGNHMGLDNNQMKWLKLSAVLHDIGKIGVRDNVLLKEGRLTDEEFKLMQKHNIYGTEILKHVEHLRDVLSGVRHHHERFDGKGYPDGIGGETIDIQARIISVADAFDAMTTNRPYRKGLSLETAFDELKKHSGTQFDPAVVDAFIASYNGLTSGNEGGINAENIDS